MKIIIELDSSQEQQAEIKRVSKPAAEQEFNQNTATVIPTSAVDGGHARIPDGYGQDNSSSTLSQQSQTAVSFAATGALDAGAAKLQEQTVTAFAMPDTGDMETTNRGKAFSAGTFANTDNN